MARTMKPGRRLERAERRAAVLAYFAENPQATYRTAAAALGIPKSTVADDLRAELDRISERSRDSLVAAMVVRNEAIVGACMPLVLSRGSVPHGSLALAADKRTADLLGLDAPTKQEVAGPEGAPVAVTLVRGS